MRPASPTKRAGRLVYLPIGGGLTNHSFVLMYLQTIPSTPITTLCLAPSGALTVWSLVLYVVEPPDHVFTTRISFMKTCT